MGRIQEDLAYFDGGDARAAPDVAEDTEFVFIGINPLKFSILDGGDLYGAFPVDPASTGGSFDDGGVIEVFQPDPVSVGGPFANPGAGLSFQQFIGSGYFIRPDLGHVDLT